MEFQPWPKIARWNREILVTEKIDGSNAQVRFTPVTTPVDEAHAVDVFNGAVGPVALHVGSRKRWLQPGKQTDNFGFAAWCAEHRDELYALLGDGGHYGEWYGVGIQRGYGLHERRLALFNTRLTLEDCTIPNVDIVPTIHEGPVVDPNQFIDALQAQGSILVPGAPAEGIVVYHKAAGTGFKILCEGDDIPKGVQR